MIMMMMMMVVMIMMMMMMMMIIMIIIIIIIIIIIYCNFSVCVLWNQAVHTDGEVTANKPDIIIKKKKHAH